MKIVFNLSKFSKAILFQRALFNIGVREAAKQIGTSPSTVSRCENKKKPDVPSYAKICLWLQVPLETFITIKK